MWLKFGVNEDNALISIEDVPKGKTSLTCLYCGGRLTAKKGRIKEHHFAHTEETCRPVANWIAYSLILDLPLYDNFNIELSGTGYFRGKYSEAATRGNLVQKYCLEVG
jgi:hypothetical protein